MLTYDHFAGSWLKIEHKAPQKLKDPLHKLPSFNAQRKFCHAALQLQLFRRADYFPVPSFHSLPAGEIPTKPNERNISKTKNLETLPSAAPWSPVLPTCLDLWICARVRPRQGDLTCWLYPLNQMVLNACKTTFWFSYLSSTQRSEDECQVGRTAWPFVWARKTSLAGKHLDWWGVGGVIRVVAIAVATGVMMPCRGAIHLPLI